MPVPSLLVLMVLSGCAPTLDDGANPHRDRAGAPQRARPARDPAEVGAVEPALQAIIDRQAIVDTIVRYAAALDAKDCRARTSRRRPSRAPVPPPLTGTTRA